MASPPSQTPNPTGEGSAQPGAVKPEGGAAEGADEYLTLKVAGADGGVVQFKTKKSTQLKKLMKAYCERQGVTYDNVRFMFDGARIMETATPEELGLESGDQIDAMVEQLGGC